MGAVISKLDRYQKLLNADLTSAYPVCRARTKTCKQVMSDNILVLGSGGREHAIAWKLSQSLKVQHVYVTPGNAGTCECGKISNIDLDINDHEAVVEWCTKHDINTVVVGPEAPLADGISDLLNKNGVPCFGPGALASKIEASKHFAKEFMKRWDIPTARFQTFTDVTEAEHFIRNASFRALVVKASGLAAGKGVIVASDEDEACKAAQDILHAQLFGSAGNTVVIEELLEGEEISCLAFTDGVTLEMMPPVQDHKRLDEGDQGPNTGGMGAYCPCKLVSASELVLIKSKILQKTVDGLREEGKLYQGVLYAGIMLTKDGPKVLEFNCRFGDPETQVLLPMMESDLYDIICACINGQLHTVTPKFYDNKYAVAVVLVANGYPNKYKKGIEIKGIDKVQRELGQTVFHAGTRLSLAGHQILTNGGRVLAVVAVDSSLVKAVDEALKAADLVDYDGKFFRRDIAKKALNRSLTYSSSGVNITAGNALVDQIKQIVNQTHRSGCATGIGMFGAAFDLKSEGFIDPLLVSGTDGVGTKLKIAQQSNKHSTIGIDLVAMCVNDILCHGAEALFFLDYFACGNLDVSVASEVIRSVANGCQEAGCALIGGETAEMPGMYGSGEYDLAGFAVGAVERLHYLPQVLHIHPGDHVIGLASTGLHSNGFSLVRRIVKDGNYSYGDKCPFDVDKTLGDVLLTPTKIYVKPVLSLLKLTKVKAIAHITGGGLPGNVTRVLPDGVCVELDANSWQIPPVFSWIAKEGNVDTHEMSRTFNCGIGLVFIVDQQEAPQTICDKLRTFGCETWLIGHVLKQEMGQKKVIIKHLDVALERDHSTSNDPLQSNVNGLTAPSPTKCIQKKRVAILISGSGTNMKALIDSTQNSGSVSSSEIALVISNKAGVKGLSLAQEAGIPTQVISHKDYKNRESFDSAIHEALTEHKIDIVCLAGFMRILTGGFVRKWHGRMLNVHPSLLPSFKGSNAHEQVLASRVRLSGCSVHFVAEEVDAGAILIQEAVPVYPDDTVETLSERVKMAEHQAFPRAMELVASGKAVLGDDGYIQWK
ncbi:hypothetical protein LSH36_77g01068 [Paralvinella palmiformis]|uniref:Trifunctional purine biosynthetic protein adenosine-3 n=1 Tax=Paralvinella palmiformis TaxID=53620 RepID=A0AAD9NAX2_9ANNE|nr:hypothetical protein LSH36_77g01068 [Paralvinella palmiformis]